MSTTEARTSHRPRPTTSSRTGYALAIVLSLLDLVGATGWPATAVSADFDPGLGGRVALAAFGVVTLVALALHLRTRRPAWIRVVAGARIVSALTAVPAFLVDGVPPALVATAAVCVLATLVCVLALLAGRPARESVRS